MVQRLLPGNCEITLIVTIRPESTRYAAGEVVIELSTGQRISVRLKPRFFRVLRILIEAAWHDRDLGLEVKGLRRQSVIGRHYAEQENVTVAPGDRVINRYVWEIRKAYKCAIEELFEKAGLAVPVSIPEIIMTTRGFGYSIGDLNVILVDHTATEACSCN